MTKDKIFTKSIPMKDGTTQDVSVTRADIEWWLTEHSLTKLISPDDDILFSNFIHAFEKDYNKSHPKPKSKRGGVREGAGRKAKAGGSFHHGFRFNKKVHDILEEHLDDMTNFVENAIIAYDRYLKREDL